MARGTQTGIPGVTRDGETYIVRLSTQVGGQRREVQRKYTGLKKAELRGVVAALQRELDETAEKERAGLEVNETLTAFAQRWLAQLAVTGRARPHTIENRTHHLERFVLPILGDVPVQKLRRSHLSSWMAQIARLRQTHGSFKGEPYRRQSLMTAWAVLRAMVKRAVVMCDLSQDPTTGMRFEVGDRVGDEVRPAKRIKDALTGDELKRLLAAATAESPDIRTMMIVGFATGMRFCEVSALEWGDINLGDGVLEIRRSQVGGHVGPPKTESTRRAVYLAPDVVEALQVHRRWQIEQQVAGLKTGRVFPSATGGYRHPQILVKPFTRCCSIAGIDKHITAHSMRKTTNNLLRQAAGDTVARAMIGHATEEMTRLYSDVDARERARAHAAAFGDSFEESVGSKCGVD